jgi:alpha-amylase
MEHCRLAGLMDFDQSDAQGPVAAQLLEWAAFIVNVTGADGLRVDTTPYVHPAFWQRFEQSAGVYAVGEVDSGDLGFAAPFQGAALSGILS